MKSKRKFVFEDSMSVGCVFRVQKFKKDGTITYDGPEFHNTVLDQALNKMENTSIHDLTKRCHVGTNGSQVYTSNEGLLEPIAHVEDTGATYGGEDETSLPYAYKRREWLFDEGDAEGDLKEVGLSTTDDFFFNRQLFKDSEGNDTTITVESDEGLRIFTEVRLYGGMNITDEETGSFEFNSEASDGTVTSGTISYTMKIDGSAFTTSSSDYSLLDAHDNVCLFDTNGGDRGATMFLSDSTSGHAQGNKANSVSQEDYVEDSHEKVFECVWDADSFSGDINMISTGHEGDYNNETAIYTFYLDETIEISENEELKFQFRRSWGRYDS